MIRTTLSIAAIGVMAAPAFAQELTYGAFDVDYQHSLRTKVVKT